MRFFILIFSLFLIVSSCKNDLSDKEILAIIHADKNYQSLQLKSEFITGEHFIDSIKSFRKTISVENLKPIYKVDFNQDGKLDYLVNLETKKDSAGDKIISFIDFDEGSRNCILLLSSSKNYKIINLTKKNVYDVFAAKPLNYHNQKLIKVLNFKPQFTYKNDILKYDTLIIRNNELTEFVGSQSRENISKIIFTKFGGYVPGLKYQLILTKDFVIINSKFYKQFEGKYVGNNNQKFNYLSSYLNEINFKNLKDKYFISCSDCSSFETKIIYGNNKTKTIYDYGERGSLGLVKLYESMNNLIENQKWKKID